MIVNIMLQTSLIDEGISTAYTAYLLHEMSRKAMNYWDLP